MTVAVPTLSRRTIRLLTDRIGWVLLACALIALGYLTIRVSLGIASGTFGILSSGVATFLLAAALYLASHAFRVLRIALLIGSWQVGLRTVASFHFFTSGVSLAFPLKLGEIYRVIELSYLVGSAVRALMIVWWERAFDVVAILIILLFGIVTAGDGPHPQYYAIAAIASVFVIGTLLVFLVLPDNLRRLSVLIIRRHDSPRSVPLLRGLSVARQAIQEAPALVRNKIASLLTLTALIWALEIACFVVLAPAIVDSVGAALDGILTFLSALTQGETILSDLDGNASALGAWTLRYLSATQVPLVIIGFGSGLIYATSRLKWSRG
jgi:hypothetical protein